MPCASQSCRATDAVELLKADVDRLCSREFSGRDVPGDYGDKAAVWLAERFQQAGLLPAVGDSTYFQQVPLRTGFIDREKTRLVFRGNDWQVEYVWGNKFYCFPKNMAVVDKSLSVGVYGYGTELPSTGGGAFPGAVKGQAALVFAGSNPNAESKSPHYGMSAFKAAAAGRAGLAALIVAHPRDEENRWEPKEISEKIELAVKRIVDSSESEPGFPILHIDPTPLEPYLCGQGHFIEWMDARDAESPTLDGVEVSLYVDFKHAEKTRAFNIVGKIPGTTSQWVALGAHYDHEGLAESDGSENPAYYPGADDNASGVAGLLEICRTWSKDGKHPRGLLAIGFTAEEDGLLGSSFFTEHPPCPWDSIAAMLNLDMIGRRGFPNMRDSMTPGSKPPEDYAAAYYSGASPLLRDVLRAAGSQSTLNLQARPVNGFRFGDAGSFHDKHIPAIHLFGGFHRDYTSVDDTPDKLDFGKLAKMTELGYEILVDLSDDPRKFDFDPSIHIEHSKMPY